MSTAAPETLGFGSSHRSYRQEDGRRINWPVDPRSEFHRLFLRNTSLAMAAAHYGLTPEEMGLALHYARLTKLMSAAAGRPLAISPPAAKPLPAKHWCGQCERLVRTAEADGCSSPWCKAKDQAA